MKTGRVISGPTRHGIMLIECLVYMAVFTVLVGIATLALYKGLDNMRAVRSNADDIARALHAGELWRDDIRSAAGPIRASQSSGVVEIPHTQGKILYRFTGGKVLRKTDADATWSVLLPKVRHSHMAIDERQQVIAWRWELELKTSSHSDVHVRPWFTFLAVPNVTNRP